MLFNLFHYFVIATCTHTHDTASTVQRMEILEHTAAIVNDANKKKSQKVNNKNAMNHDYKTARVHLFININGI